MFLLFLVIFSYLNSYVCLSHILSFFLKLCFLILAILIVYNMHFVYHYSLIVSINWLMFISYFKAGLALTVIYIFTRAETTLPVPYARRHGIECHSIYAIVRHLGFGVVLPLRMGCHLQCSEASSLCHDLFIRKVRGIRFAESQTNVAQLG